uniref:MCF.2 cell line derived transforming sequence-like 2 n=1 Tax=Cynoglossus semilaevis TaxID=244447 RepID=A0A3P8UQ71_CYNSE
MNQFGFSTLSVFLRTVCLTEDYVSPTDEIMQQEIRPLLAVDIIEQLHRQFALLSGGRGKDGAPIITFPEYSGFSDVPEEDFHNVITYLTSIPSLDAASIGFVIIIDRRKDKWSTVKASLSRISGAFPGNLQLVLVLRPSRFFQRTIADIGIRLHKDDFKMKIVMLNSLSDLHGYVDRGQLTLELGGSLEYCHSQWIHHRTAIESFAVTVKTTAEMLQKFGTDLAETELPNDVQCTKDLLTCVCVLQDELKLALKQGNTLLTCIRHQAAKSENQPLNPDEKENQTTVERLLAQLDETDNAFEQFWCKHHLRLEQCLQLRHFEQDFREVKVSLDSLSDNLTSLPVFGDSLARVEHLLKELTTLADKAQPTVEKAQLHALHGDQLIQSNHYAVDSIRPKCVELRRVCDDFTNEVKRKKDVLSKSQEIHNGIEKVNQWCESGIYLLASQAVDKCQSQDGAESALTDLEQFMDSAPKNQLTELRNLHNQYEVVLSEDLKAGVMKALSRLEDVQEMFEKRLVSLKRLSAKQTRPVQPVAPRPESSPKCPPVRNTTRTTGNHTLTLVSGKVKDVTRVNDLKLSVRRLIMTELIETERLYVEELQSIIEGYIAEFDNSELSHLTPPSLDNKREVLFGNLPEIYDFHNRCVTFLRELENCMEKPEMVGTCFLKRVNLQYFTKKTSIPLSDLCTFFYKECQKKLDHKLSLDAYLLKPVQRITKYQLMLKVRHKHIYIYMRSVKDLARFKPMQRHLFLYEKMLLFCKRREETTDGHEKTPSYSFKHSRKKLLSGRSCLYGGCVMLCVCVCLTLCGCVCVCARAFVPQAPSMDVKNMWVSQIRKVLTGQLEACRGTNMHGTHTHTHTHTHTYTVELVPYLH